MEAICIFHKKLARAQKPKSRTQLIAEFQLDLIEIKWESFVGFDIGFDKLGNALFVCWC